MKRFAWPITIYLLMILSLIFVWQESTNVLRPFITLTFISLCPGMAFIRLIKIDHWYIELMLAITLSIAIGQLVSMLVLYFGIWSVHANMLLLAIITFWGASLQIKQLLFSPQPNL